MRTQIRRKPKRCCRPSIGKDSFSSLPTSRKTSDTCVRERFRILKQTRCEIRRTLRAARVRHPRGLRRELQRDRQRHRRFRGGSRGIVRWRQRLWKRCRLLQRKKISARAANTQTESTLFRTRSAIPAPAKTKLALHLFRLPAQWLLQLRLRAKPRRHL